MITLSILAVWTVLCTLGSLLLLKDGYKKEAKFLMCEMCLAPVGFILFLIIVIGFAPMSMG